MHRSHTFILLCMVTLPASALAQQGVAGCWAGTMGSGGDQRRAVLELEQSGGEWTGRIHRLSSEVETDTLTSVTVRDGRVHFEILAAEGTPSVQAQLADAGLTLAGEAIVGGDTLPVPSRA